LQLGVRPAGSTASKLTDKLKPTTGVRCVDCGFLNLVDLNSLWGRLQTPGSAQSADEDSGAREIFPADRDRIRFRRLRGAAGLNCYRHIPLCETETDEPLRRDELDKRTYDGVLGLRQCAYFQPYQPGLSPADHLLLHVQPAARPDAVRIPRDYWALTGAVGVAALIAGLVLRPLLDLALGIGR
jgi:hypothetical protein